MMRLPNNDYDNVNVLTLSCYHDSDSMLLWYHDKVVIFSCIFIMLLWYYTVTMLSCYQIFVRKT
jgi:hypothetical protein